MAIRISHWLWFQSQILKPLHRRDHNFGYRYIEICDHDAALMKQCIEEMLTIQTNDKRAIALRLEEFHQILRTITIPASVYVGIGQVVLGLELAISRDLELAIKYAYEIARLNEINPARTTRLNWRARAESMPSTPVYVP